LGAEFAIGFLYGVDLGKFNNVGEMSLCIEKQANAGELFTTVESNLKTALKNKDITFAIENLQLFIDSVT